MDRRRFVPSPEGLEGRALLSLFGHNTSTGSKSGGAGLFGFGNVTTSNDSIPETFQAKQLRIDHLPFYIERIRPGRFIPNDVVAQLQKDLRPIVTQLHWPGNTVLEVVNHDMRAITARPSLSVADASELNHSFGRVLESAGATPEAQANLQADMNNLARVDTSSPQPTFLATNDYALVIQTVLGIGRPIARPTAPSLKANTGKILNPNYFITGRTQPTLVGTYDAVQTGSTGKVIATTTSMQIVDASGHVFGIAPIDSNGNYAVQFAAPLPEGVHLFYVRAVDDQGHMSNFSPPFKVKIISRHRDVTAAESLTPPGGPLGLKP
jgi:hypothetical protein